MNRVNRDQRIRTVRPHTESPRRIGTGKALPIVRRPKTRGECVGGARPCPFVGCRYNLYLDISARGNIKFNFPDLPPEDMPAYRSCALDLADSGPLTLYEIGAALNLTRARAMQIVQYLMDRLGKHFTRDEAA